MVKICAIVAMDPKRVIGKGGALPWHLKEDLKRFAALTTGHTVLMGRKTYESLPDRFRPLPNRLNVVATRDPAAWQARLKSRPTNVWVVSDPAEFAAGAREGRVKLPSDQLWVIGGAEIYRATQGLWDEAFVTLLSDEYEGDTYLPEFESRFELSEREDLPEARVSFLRYSRRP